MFWGVFAQQPSTKVLRSFFKSDRLPTPAPAGASAFFFFLSFFFLCLLPQKEKAGLRAYALQNRCKPRKNIKKSYLRRRMYLLHTYRFINTQGGAPLFLLAKKAQKKKFPKRKAPFWGVSLTAVSAKGYAPLTGTAWPAGACWLRCEHSALNNNLSPFSNITTLLQKADVQYLSVKSIRFFFRLS